MSIAEKKLEIIRKVSSSTDEHFVERLLRQVQQQGGIYAGETEQAKRQFEEFDQQYSSVLKRLAE